MPPVRKLFFWPYQLYAWLLFIPFALLWSFFCGWMAVLAAVVVNPRFSSRYVGGPWARVIGRLTPMPVTLVDAQNADPSRTYVVVCNHASHYDILLVYGWLKLDLKWVMKKELRKLPGIGAACEKVGHIFVDRSRPELAKRSINEALQRLGEGVGILFFPEGTRSPTGRLRGFKTGAFRTAVDQQLPILPISIIGTQRILPAKTLRLFPGRGTMHIHAPIEPEGKSVRDLMNEAHATINSALPDDQRVA